MHLKLTINLPSNCDSVELTINADSATQVSKSLDESKKHLSTEDFKRVTDYLLQSIQRSATVVVNPMTLENLNEQQIKEALPLALKTNGRVARDVHTNAKL